MSLPDAYLEIVVPTLPAKAQQKAEQTVVESLKKQAAAQTMNPSAPGAATADRPTSFRDKRLTW